MVFDLGDGTGTEAGFGLFVEKALEEVHGVLVDFSWEG